MDKLFELLGYLIDNDRGLTNYDTDHLKKLLNEAKKETCPGKEERTNDEA